MMLVALTIFFLTLLLIIWQPKGLQIGTSAMLGALAALTFGVVSWNDVLEVISIVWDATLAFIGIIILSMVLDEIGFFEWAALKMAKLSGGSGTKLFIYSLMLGAVVATFFANDGAALILTPILLSKMQLLRLDHKALFAFVMAGGFIGDSASNPLVISNLTNILTADYFHIGFWEYAKHMFWPNLLSVLASIVVLYLYFRKSIPKKVDISILKEPKEAIKSPAMFWLSWLFLAFLLIGYFIGDLYHIPISIFALGGALLFLALGAKFKAIKPLMTLKIAPWQVVWFSIGLYVVVFGLKNAGLTHQIANIILYLQSQSQFHAVYGTGFLAALLSAVMNNMPTVMIMDIALEHAHAAHLAYANILGCNLGPKMTPIGSLATLLWLHVLANKGVKIGWGEYMKVGVVITPPVLAVALLGLVGQ